MTTTITSERDSYEALSDEALLPAIDKAFAECEAGSTAIQFLQELEPSQSVLDQGNELFLQLIVIFIDLVAVAAGREHLRSQLSTEHLVKAAVSKSVILALIERGSVVIHNA